MKSAYELAMERLNKSSPGLKLTAEQKRELAALDTRYGAKQAEREIVMKDAIAQATAKGDFEEVEKLDRHWATERAELASELERKKDEVRQRGSGRERR